MGAKEWSDEEVQAEIRKAVDIVNEDRERKTYADLHTRFGTLYRNGDDPGKEGKTNPPLKKDDEPKEPVAKKSLWWGEMNNEE